MALTDASILPLVGALLQLGGAALLVGLFLLLRRYVLRRPYFSAWVGAWAGITAALVAIVVGQGMYGSDDRVAGDSAFAPQAVHFFYQGARILALVLFLRGTVIYVAGRSTMGVAGRGVLFAAAIALASLAAVTTRNSLDEMMIWQSVISVPILGYCGSALLWLPRSRRTLGSVATGTGFCLLATFWLVRGGASALIIGHADTPLSQLASLFIGLGPYVNLFLEVVLAYGMVVLLMEDSRREVADAQAELRMSHDRLKRAAMFDSLTDSLNRRAFVEGVGLEMARATFGTVVMADIDNLKVVNDQHGHAVGDLVIRRCADVLRSALRPYDKLYRWGGDEFLLVVPSAHSTDMLDRLRAALMTAASIDSPMDGRKVELEVSIGGADYASAEEINTAIDRADLAMYDDKGRRKGEPRNSPAALRLSHIASLR